MNVKCELIEKISKEGKPYKALIISLTDNYKKTVFLDKAEIEIIQIMNRK